MRAAEESPLAGGVCVDLPTEVVDKYFMANPVTERFQFLTAKAICGRCAVQAACLTDAIKQGPTEIGIRGGESARAITELRYRRLRGEATAGALATAAILAQPEHGGLLQSRILRRGRFSNALLLPQRGSQWPEWTIAERQGEAHNGSSN